jgi:predicted lipoprotein with Yx(FWY)xxD motif
MSGSWLLLPLEEEFPMGKVTTARGTLRRTTMSTRRASALLGAGALGAVALTAAACGSGSTTGTGTTQAPGAGATATVSIVPNSKYGKVLVDSSGRTLYHFKLDKNGQSACTGSCASIWPPLTVPAGTTPAPGSGVSGLGVIMRSDGKDQVTWNGEPLYTYSGDSGAGQFNGEGIQNLWFVASAGGGTGGGGGGTTTSTAARGYGY